MHNRSRRSHGGIRVAAGPQRWGAGWLHDWPQARLLLRIRGGKAVHAVNDGREDVSAVQVAFDDALALL
jgi:hypothetical protein